MYDHFDSFLDRKTWYTRHPDDLQCFYEALSAVVKNPDFDPDRLGEHITAKFDLADSAGDDEYSKAADYYVAAAWAVRKYLQTVGEINS